MGKQRESCGYSIGHNVDNSYTAYFVNLTLITTKVSFSYVVSLGRYVQMFVLIIMYNLGLFFVFKMEITMFKFDSAHWVNKLHVSTKFHSLIWFCY